MHLVSNDSACYCYVYIQCSNVSYKATRKFLRAQISLILDQQFKERNLLNETINNHIHDAQ